MTRTLSSYEIAQAAIELALKDIAPRWKADTVAHYERAAKQEFANVSDRLKDPNEAQSKSWYENKLFPFRFVGMSKAYDKKRSTDYRISSFQMWRNAALQGGLVCLIKNARLAGERAYENAHHDFVFRGASKIAEVFGPGSEMMVTCELTYRAAGTGAIEGTASASSGAGKLTVSVAVMTNYRYGENAADGVLTVYGQYPMRVISVTNRNGSTFDGAISLEEAAVLISGLNPVEAKRLAKVELKAKKKARSDALWELEKLKRHWDDIASWYRFNDVNAHYQTTEQISRQRAALAERCAKHGLVDPGSKKAVNEIIKLLREQMKALKGSPL